MNEIKRVFGYGSLVNRATHSYSDPRKATLAGWRRVWKQAAHRPVAFLSVEPCSETTLLGLVANVPGQDWEALDAREAAYLRREATHQIDHDGESGHTVVYEANPDHVADPSTDHPILLSYLDVVVQGYLREWGEDGVHHLFQTTRGFEGPILDDRTEPIYPRAQPLSRAERRRVDTALADIGARLIHTPPAMG